MISITSNKQQVLHKQKNKRLKNQLNIFTFSNSNKTNTQTNNKQTKLKKNSKKT